MPWFWRVSMVLLYRLKECGVRDEVGTWLAVFLDSAVRQQAVGVPIRTKCSHFRSSTRNLAPTCSLFISWESSPLSKQTRICHFLLMTLSSWKVQQKTTSYSKQIHSNNSHGGIAVRGELLLLRMPQPQMEARVWGLLGYEGSVGHEVAFIIFQL